MTVNISTSNPLYTTVKYISDLERSIQEQAVELSQQDALIRNMSVEIQGLAAVVRDLEGKTKPEWEVKADIIIIAGLYAAHLGIPYVFGGTYNHADSAKTKAFDCSAFCQSVFSLEGITLPRVSKDQAKKGTEVKYEDLRKGDLVFFDTNKDGVINHVGIYMGGGNLLHTNNSTENIHVEKLEAKYRKWFVTARRVL